MGLLIYINQDFWKWLPWFSMTVCAWQLAFCFLLQLYTYFGTFRFTYSGLCFVSNYDKQFASDIPMQNKTKKIKRAVISAAVCIVTLSNKYHISVYWCVRLVTDVIIQAALNGYYSNWVNHKLASSCTDEVPGNILHRSDWYIKSVGLYLAVIACSVM